MGPPAFYTKVLNYMKVGQHYYSTLYKGQEPLELLMVFNPDPSQLSLKFPIKNFPLWKLSRDFKKDMLWLITIFSLLFRVHVTQLPAISVGRSTSWYVH